MKEKHLTTIEIILSQPQKDFLKELWIKKRTRALHLIQESSIKNKDDLSQIALGYLIELLKLDGDNEYILKQEKERWIVNENN